MSWQQLHCRGKLASTHHLQDMSASSLSNSAAKFSFVWFSMTKVLFKAVARSKLLDCIVTFWAVRAKLLGSEVKVVDASLQ